MPESDEEGFLLRWSRRKRSAGRTEGAGRPARDEGAVGDGQGAVGGTPETAAVHGDAGPRGGVAEARPGERADRTHGESPGQDQDAGGAEAGGVERVPEDLVGVEVEALDYEADFTRFMKEDVPEALKRRALRQLWRSDPILANVDGLNDYDDDFTDAALAVKVLQTAHKIGRGYLDDDEVAEAADAKPEGEDGGTDVADDAGDDNAGEVSDEAGDDAVAPRDGDEAGAVAMDDHAGEVAARDDDGEAADGDGKAV